MKMRRLYKAAGYLFVAVLAGLLCYQVYSVTKVKSDIHIIYIPKLIDDTNEFWSSLIAGAQVAAKEYDVRLTLMAPELEDDIDGQNGLILKAIGQKPDVLIISPSSYEETAPYVEQAVKAHIKVLFLDSDVDTELKIPLVSTNNFEIGKKLGEYMVPYLPARPEIALVGHVEGASTAIDRERGIRAGLGEGETYITAVEFCNSVYQTAYDVTRKLLTENQEINIIAGFNEYSSLGAARAIDDMGLKGKVLMFGIDSSVSQIQMLESGVYSGLAVQNPFNMGYIGIEEAVQYARGERVPLFVDSGSKMITKSDIYTDENEMLLFPFLGSWATKKEEIQEK